MTTCMTEVIAHAHRSNAAKIAYFDGQSSALVLSQRIEQRDRKRVEKALQRLHAPTTHDDGPTRQRRTA